MSRTLKDQRASSSTLLENRSSVFVSGGGETGKLFRSIDWAKSPLGAVETWPQSLKVILNVIFNSSHPMFVWWGSELIQFYNDAYLPSFGKGKHPKAMGQRGVDCWPEIWPIIFPQIEGVMERGVSTWHRNQLIPIFRNGTIEDVYWTYGYSPIFDDEGRIGGTLVVCSETTDQVLAKQKLQEAHKQTECARRELYSFLMQLPIGVAMLSGPEHIYSFVNSSFMSILFGGLSEDHLLHKPVRQALPELQGQGFFEILDEVYRTGVPFNGSKLRLSVIQASGREKEMFINFTYRPKRNADGRIDGILAVVYEVTDQVNEQKEIEQLANNLRAAVTSRDTFLGVASHELKTPLTALKLQSQINQMFLKRQADKDHPQNQKFLNFVETTLVQTDRLERLVNDVLDVSRIRSGKLTIQPVSTNLSNLVFDTIKRFSNQFEVAGCPLKMDITPHLYSMVDPVRIEQVLNNFITNILKYAPGAAVEVTVTTDAKRIVVSLRDHGPGIAPEDQERIFDRFERATPTDGISGLGLGLYISKQIIQDHSGRIFVNSKIGEGSEFGFELMNERYPQHSDHTLTE